MFDRLDQLEERYEDLGRQLSDPKIVNDQENYRKVSKAHRDIEPTVEKFRDYRKIKDGIAEAKAMLADADPDVKAMAQEELATLEPQLEPVEEALKVLLLPKDPNDEKNVILELRAGTGGDEAALFVAEVFRMYMRFAEQHKWKVEVLSQTESGIGHGLKDVTAIIEGNNVYSQLKYESVRASRAAGSGDRDAGPRASTSAITVAVLPRGGRGRYQDRGEGPLASTRSASVGGRVDPVGGNTTYSAVRITHLPTNTVVSCQDEEVADQEPREGVCVCCGPGCMRGRGRADSSGSRRKTARRRLDVGRPQQEKIRRLQFPPEPHDGPPHQG